MISADSSSLAPGNLALLSRRRTSSQKTYRRLGEPCAAPADAGHFLSDGNLRKGGVSCFGHSLMCPHHMNRGMWMSACRSSHQ